eukprot:2120625-Pyramimonas_sp.AAC.1
MRRLTELPGFEPIHTLSVSRERVSTVAFNESGEWLALGCATLGQLLVWEWRSETYILKQQGHYFDVNHVAYSQDGALVATAADDTKLKVPFISNPITLFHGSSCANNDKGALNTPESLPLFSTCVHFPNFARCSCKSLLPITKPS